LVQLDVSAEASVIHAVEEKAWISFGFIDILLNNAGFRGTEKDVLELDEADWNGAMHNVNLCGA